MRPSSILCLLFVLNGCRAGIQIHNPKSFQQSSNVADRKYYTTNMVTMCPLNVVFVLDGSDSVSPYGFELARAALVREIERVYSAFANTDIGVIVFSDTTMEDNLLKLRSRTPAELQILISEVQRLEQPRKKTALPVAVKRARQELVDYSQSTGRKAYDGYRSGGLMVLITDGVPDNTLATIQEAKLAKDNRIIIISLSIENANRELLRDISNVVQDSSTPIDWQSSVACPATVLPPVKSNLEDCNDFLLITDGSDSVLRYNETVRQFLIYTALRFKYADNRIGVKLFGTDASAQRRNTMIRPMSDKYVLAETIREKLVFPKSGGTGTDIAVNQAVEVLMENPIRRRTTLVLITDGPPLDPQAVRQAIQNAVNNNFQVIIIRVGTVLTDSTLNLMAGTGRRSYSVEDFTGLYSVDFSGAVCASQIVDIVCTPPLMYDPESNDCKCLKQCPENSVLLSNCTCQCNGLAVMSQGACVCANYCPANRRQQRDCQCKCIPGYVEQLGRCVPSQPCPSNAVRQIDGTCRCNPGLVLQNGRCDCPNPCPFNSVRQSGCTCQCNVGYVMLNGFCTEEIQPCPPKSVPLTDGTCRCNSGLVMQSGRCVCAPQFCPNGQDEETCICNRGLCPNPCPANSVRQQFDCTCICHPGFVKQGGQCVRQTTDCPSLQCQNGQRALRDCEGNCYCSCSPGFTGDQCEIRVTAELCDDCHYSNGQYLAGVKGSCQLFVTCLPADGSQANGRVRPSRFLPVVKSCASGTLYLTRPNGWRGCDFPGNGVCEQETCATLPSFANYADHNSCRSYWACGGDGKTMGRRCCPSGTAFDSTRGQCVPDTSCQQRCPLEAPKCLPDRGLITTTQAPTCNIGRNPNNLKEWYYMNNPSQKFYCNNGFIMDLTFCKCRVNPVTSTPISSCKPTVAMDFETVLVGEFDGIVLTQVPGHPGRVGDLITTPDLDIIFKQFSGSGFYVPYFRIDVKVRWEGQLSGIGKIAVVTNADCNVDDSVSITMDSQQFYFRVKLEGTSNPIVIPIPYSGRQDAFGFYSLTLIYARNRLFSGSVGDWTETYSGSTPLSGYIEYRQCAMHLGKGFGYQKFIGYVDDLYIWRCEPTP